MKGSNELHRQKVLMHIWDLLTTNKKIDLSFISTKLDINLSTVKQIITRDHLKGIIARHNKHPNRLAYNPNI